MLRFLHLVQYNAFHFPCNRCQLQKLAIPFNRYFTESSIKQELPDPHALVQDPNDPSGKTRYNTDNEDMSDGLAGQDGQITDEMFVEGMIVAMEEHCPDVKNITEDQKKDMVGFVGRHKHVRLRK